MRAPTPGCCFDDREFFRCQRSRLSQHGVADADLADVMQQRAEAQRVQFLVGQFHLASDGDRHRADALGVAGGVGIPRVERERQRADGADVGVARLGLRGADRLHHRVERRGE